MVSIWSIDFIQERILNNNKLVKILRLRTTVSFTLKKKKIIIIIIIIIIIKQSKTNFSVDEYIENAPER